MTQPQAESSDKVDATTTPQQPTSPRKRRRRAPVTGAADDCFACQERQSKCDRRRPYCTPCLDLGKDCSGYKTTLTWGVGVASRGKLRGLALPVTNSKRAAPADEDDADKPKSPPKKIAKSGTTRNGSASSKAAPEAEESNITKTHTTPMTPTNYGFVNINASAAPSTTTPVSASNAQWRRPHSLSHTRGLRMSDKKQRRHTLQPIHVASGHPARDYGVMPMTASIVGGYGHQNFEFTQMSPALPSFPGYDVPTSQVREYLPPTSAPYDTTIFNSSHLPWASRPISPTMGSDHQSPPQGHIEMPSFFGGVDEIMSLHNVDDSRTSSITTVPDDGTFTPESNFHILGEAAPALVTDDVGAHASYSVARMPSLPVGRTPELQFLIDYYDKVISPVIVAFDSPTNPYRTHILQLAMDSDPLQHAIATLAACNLRIRRSQSQELALPLNSDNTGSAHDVAVQQAHIAHKMLTADFDNMQHVASNESMAQELYHKSLAIQGLNEQLADHGRRQDDSVLASLLMLCLYHVCDTGIAKFKTQSAGVKKLLAIRNRKSSSRSQAANWLTIMFTWFDSLSASVNDREGELSPNAFGGSQSYENDWSLENLAGCDTQLFKTISKLGRLNLLRQNRSSSTPPEGLASPPLSSSNDYYSMRNAAFDNSTASYSDLRSTAHPTSSSPSSEFWREWSTVRQSLQSWAFPPNTPPLSGNQAPSDRQDLLHISESFRYSALLYTERLAFPSLPSSHPSLQVLVSQALHHIMRVKSDVFLLWPLFITGTETVAEGSRQMVREKVWQLQRDSGFFNNLSCLQLLERIWKDGSVETSDQNAASGMNGVTGLSAGEYSGNGFRWRKAMERADGEYIVV